MTAGAGLRIGSLFSGIGGLELGLEWAGVGHTVWQCELSNGQSDLFGKEDTYTRAVLKRHWPDMPRFDDVRTLGKSGAIPPADVLCAGFPCQDISAAKQDGEGLNGKKSGLFWEVIRIAEIIKPRFIVLENVANLVNRGLRTVLRALAKIRYDAEWHTLSAADVGAPHLRKRVFIIAWRQLANNDHQRPQGHSRHVKMVNQSRRFDKGQNCREIGNVSFPFPPGPQQLQMWQQVPMDFKPAVCGVANGFSSWVGNRKSILIALGNAVVPQCAEVIGQRLLEIYYGQTHAIESS